MSSPDIVYSIQNCLSEATLSVEKAIAQMKLQKPGDAKLPEEIKQAQKVVSDLRLTYILHRVSLGHSHAVIGASLGLTAPRITQILTKHKQSQAQ